MLNYFNILFLLRSISFSGTTSLRLIYYRTRCDRAVYGVVLCLPVYLSQDITESKWLNVWLMLYDSPDVIVFWRFRIIRCSGNVVTAPHSGGPLFLSLSPSPYKKVSYCLGNAWRAKCQLNRVKCGTNVRRIAFDKSCNKPMTFKVTEGHCWWHKSILWYFLLLVCSNNVCILHNFFLPHLWCTWLPLWGCSLE